MVFYFECCDPKYIIYMGKDKYENEELLKYGFSEDVCKLIVLSYLLTDMVSRR